MQLGDLFPEGMREQLANENLQLGAILRYFDNNTTPPKIKRKVVVGFDTNQVLFAYVRINTEINPRLFPTPRSRNLHLELKAMGRAYIEHDSFVNCSEIEEEDMQTVLEMMKNDTSIHIGHLDQTDITDVLDKLRTAYTIEPRIKRKFGFI